MSCYRLRDERCYLWIDLLGYDSSDIGVIRSAYYAGIFLVITGHPLEILLPLSLFLALIMQ